MKITEKQLKKLINEELQKMVESGEVDEGFMDFFGGKKSKSDYDTALDVENKLSEMMQSIQDMAKDLNKNHPSLKLATYLVDIFKALGPARRAVAEKKMQLQKK